MARQKVKVTFSKTGLMKFISHLDLMRCLQRALRRADIPVSLTHGYNPHPKLSFERALRLGVESQKEVVSFTLDEPIALGELKARLKQQLPEGITIKEVSSV